MDLYSTPFKRHYVGPKTLRNAQATAVLGRIGQSNVPLSVAMRALRQGLPEPIGMSQSSATMSPVPTVGPAVGSGLDVAAVDTSAANDGLGKIGGAPGGLQSTGGALSNTTGAGTVSGPSQEAEAGAGAKVGGDTGHYESMMEASVKDRGTGLIGDSAAKIGKGLLGALVSAPKAVMSNPFGALQAVTAGSLPGVGLGLVDTIGGIALDAHTNMQDRATMSDLVGKADEAGWDAKSIGNLATQGIAARNQNTSNGYFGKSISGRIGNFVGDKLGLDFNLSDPRSAARKANVSEPGPLDDVAYPGFVSEIEKGRAVQAEQDAKFAAMMDTKSKEYMGMRTAAREQALAELEEAVGVGTTGSFGFGADRPGFGPQRGAGTSNVGGGVSVGVSSGTASGGSPGDGGPGGHAW